MTIERANRPYDPQDARSRAEAAALRQAPRRDLPPPPKPGITLGLLAWTLTGAIISITAIITAVVTLWR